MFRRPQRIYNNLHVFSTSSNYPDQGLVNHNYCRRPNGAIDRVWCITTNRYFTLDFCDVPECPGKNNIVDLTFQIKLLVILN